ncbi:hypothetical protein MNBD_GAMMA26-2566 [hydrothermal vent metagenome]|uniref:Formylmethanofuran dehydrogenase subunit E domain-containing protein n=1 Tax=hydrothermal vent metagenome TaxID=652676 RepID=A0A3B1BMQ1_9ZZZZ
MSETLMFPRKPVIHLYDPLGDLLGAGDGVFSYTFDDVAKMSGHACPTVVGGFLLVKRAVEELWGDDMPQRGDIRVTVYGAQNEGTNGPISQVFTLLTGAAADNGFHGLGGQFARCGLLQFHSGDSYADHGFRFERISTGDSVTLIYDPSGILPAPTMGEDLGNILGGFANEETVKRFRDAWRERVLRILEDAGKSTVSPV